MKKLNANGLRWLKGFHLIAASCWVGGVVALMLLYFLKNGVTDGGVLYGMNQSIHHVDIWVVVTPGAFGCLFTGLAYSLFSHWGFFKHNWLTVKWVITIVAIASGTIFLGPWEVAMLETSGKLGISALNDQVYLYNQKMNFIFGMVQCFLLIFTLFISVFKPWKKKKADDKKMAERHITV
jgi:uncharacterized membrane protein